MSYGMLWIEGLVIALLWAASAVAVSARIRSHFRAGLNLFAALAVLAVALGAPLALSALMKFGLHLTESWFGYCLGLFIASWVGALIIVWVGRRRPAPGAARAAAAWPAGRLLVALGAMVLLHIMTYWNADLAVRNEAANLRTEAGAMLLSVAPPQVDDDRNAAVLYEKAFARMNEDKSLTSPDSPLGQENPDPTNPMVAQLLDRQAKTLRLLREAGAMPACRFEHDYAHPSYSMLLPELNGCRTAAQLLALAAKQEAVTGHAPQAVDDMNALFRLGRAAGSDPGIISSLVQIGIDAIGVKTLQAVVPHLKGAEELRRLRMGDVDAARRQARRSLRGEEAFGISVFSDLASGRLTLSALLGDARPRGPNPDFADIPPIPILLRIFVMPSDVQAYKQYLERCREQVQEPFTPATVEDASASGFTAARHGLLTSVIMPALHRYLERVVLDEALRAGALTGIAIDRYRLDHGAFPPTLDALSPQYLDEVPRDPFDGHLLRYIVHNGEALVYSIGPDLKDDGAAAFDNEKQTGDLVFTIRAGANASSSASAPR